MHLLVALLVTTATLFFCFSASAQKQFDQPELDANAHHDQSIDADVKIHASIGPALTHTDDIKSALADGGEPIVADVLGVVCDFCALAMNKIFSKREEVAAIYVDLDTKALSLVLVPGASLSDHIIADLAVQAGYRIADIRRGDAALGTST